jgi:hypothetical protein
MGARAGSSTRGPTGAPKPAVPAVLGVAARLRAMKKGFTGAGVCSARVARQIIQVRSARAGVVMGTGATQTWGACDVTAQHVRH